MTFKEKVYSLLSDLNQFQYIYNHGDRLWHVIFLDKKKKWRKISVSQYRDAYYVNLINDDICMLEVKIGKSVMASSTHNFSRFGYREEEDLEKVWGSYIDSAQNWLKRVKRDWIKANTMITLNYPLNCRTGYVSHAIVRNSLSDVYRLDKVLGKKVVAKFIKIVESDYFHDSKKTICSTMTAKRYFEYCKIAYIASQDKDSNIDEKLSGKELYKRYADGRHEGLLDIDLNSEDEFSSWLDGSHPKRDRGGHPWEIKRGGNTTHIDLFVSRPSYPEKNGFNVTINARAITRMAEAIRMFLALYDAGMPIQIADHEAIRKRLLAQDNIGIVAKYNSLHRANQYYPEDQAVYDVMHFDDLGRSKRRIKDFIVWEPLPLLIPKSV